MRSFLRKGNNFLLLVIASLFFSCSHLQSINIEASLPHESFVYFKLNKYMQRLSHSKRKYNIRYDPIVFNKETLYGVYVFHAIGSSRGIGVFIYEGKIKSVFPSHLFPENKEKTKLFLNKYFEESEISYCLQRLDSFYEESKILINGW